MAIKTKPMKWHKNSKKWQAWGAGISYTISCFDSVIDVTINNLVKRDKDEPRSSDKPTRKFTSYREALDFVEKEHYPHFISEFVEEGIIDGYFTKFTKWARDRKIIQNGSILAQGLKLVSEVGELADNLAKGRCIKDDIGDCMVVLNNLAHMNGLTLEECLEQAWNDIKDRKGTMNEHGVFIKEADNG